MEIVKLVQLGENVRMILELILIEVRGYKLD
jgi:hypothetical protein